jgi:hypothetical protein
MIVNDASRVVRMMIVVDAPRCGISYNCHSDKSRGVIYTPRVVNYGPREHLRFGVIHTYCHMTIKNIFIVHATSFMYK